jgi:hypothetical protein
VLARLGVTTQGELDRCSDSDLLKDRGCGKKTLLELRGHRSWPEYHAYKAIAARCRAAHLFLESRGYTVIAPDKPTFYVQMAGRGNRAKAIQEKGGAE